VQQGSCLYKKKIKKINKLAVCLLGTESEKKPIKIFKKPSSSVL